MSKCESTSCEGAVECLGDALWISAWNKERYREIFYIYCEDCMEVAVSTNGKYLEDKRKLDLDRMF